MFLHTYVNVHMIHTYLDAVYVVDTIFLIDKVSIYLSRAGKSTNLSVNLLI